MYMINIGAMLRQKTPKLYFPLIKLKQLVDKATAPYCIYITDSLGGSFKVYFEKHPMVKIKQTLLSGLDKESFQVVDVVCKRLCYYPDECKKGKIKKSEPIIGGLLPVESLELNKKISLKLKEVESACNLPKKSIDASVFYFYHGLAIMTPAVIDYVKGEDFVDLGAYIGDSAIALNKYGYKKIFSIEMSRHSINRYLNNMQKANISSEKYEIINVAVADKDNLPLVELPDTGSAGFSLLRERGKYDFIKIQQKSFDTIVKEYDIEPKFIKVDIEGYAMNFIKGALQSLKKYRPVLSIAIYHNPIEFFEIKPLLEQELSNYQFMIRKLTPLVHDNLCHSEVVLLGYPRELI